MRILILLILILQGSSYTIEVADAGYAIITHEIYFTAEEHIDSYQYYVPFPIHHLEVYSDRAVKGEYTIFGRQTEVTLHVSLEKGESAYCICEYLTWEITYKEGTQWWLYLPETEESVTVIMPKGAVISYFVTESDFPSISEEDGRIHLFWEHLPDEVYMYYELSLTNDSRWNFLVFVFPFLGLFGLSYLFYLKRRSRNLSKSVLSVLNERERKIVEYLHAKGRSRQAKISRDCKIPKTTLSKILMKMEERGIIKRERDGSLTYCELDQKVYQ